MAMGTKSGDFAQRGFTPLDQIVVGVTTVTREWLDLYPELGSNAIHLDGSNASGQGINMLMSASAGKSRVMRNTKLKTQEKLSEKNKDVPKKERVSSQDNKPSKVEKSKKTESIGNKFTKKTEVRPSKERPGQSRAEYVSIKNKDGKSVKTYKDSYDRANKFQGRKPLRGGPEGRPQ